MIKKSLGRCLQQVVKLAAVQTVRERDDGELLEWFVTHKDEAAFAVLVERHGPMVLGVCRRLLGSAADAEDACQAAFLVLAQKAASIRNTTSLSSWLHGVASRVASHLKREHLRRNRRERASNRRPPPDPAAEVSWREVLTVLDEELERLPERNRAPLILCYLDGQTRDEAAQRLGISVTCLHGRLERGRKALCSQLTRRGITLSAALIAAGITEGAARAALAPTTVLYTARAAVLVGAGAALDPCLISTRVLALTQEVSRNMTVTKLKLGMSAILCAGILATALGASLALGLARAGQATKTLPVARHFQRGAGETSGQTTIRGRVLGLDDKPVAGARVYLLKWGAQGKAPPKVWAETGNDGRFSAKVPQRDLGELFVIAPGHGPGWVIKPGKLQERWPFEDNQVVRLAPDDVPVNGRLLDLQGQPIAGATIRVFALKASPDGKLDSFTKAIKSRTTGQHFLEHEHLSACRFDGLAHFFPPITTDKAGRFQIKGVGRDRVVSFTIEAPTIETTVLDVLTKTSVGVGDLRVPAAGITFAGGKTVEVRMKPYYPASFTHPAAPCRIVTGVVRDKATGKPITGVIVRGDQPIRYPLSYNRTTTDRDGRFRLTGLPLPRRYEPSPGIVALPPGPEPYLAMIKRLPADRESKEATLDFDLPPGVWLEGHVKDKVTGRGVLAQFQYKVFQKPARPDDGPQGFGQPGPYYQDPYGNMTDTEGKFRIVVARERAVLGVSAIREQAGRYRKGVGADKIEGMKDYSGGGLLAVPEPLSFTAGSFNTVIEVKPPKGAKRMSCDIVLDPGLTRKVQVRGPDGKPLDGVRARGQLAGDNLYQGQKPLSAEFTVYGLEPGKGRTLLLEHPQKNLAARCEIKANERGPIVVTLQPGATVTGRLVEGGEPLANADIVVRFRLGKGPEERLHSRQFRTDARGKFRIDTLIPGVSYRADARTAGYLRTIFDDLALKSGETKDVGDVKLTKGDGQ
jgi:RNA polymerase sigma factor (sigma-70 family)